ncbi:2OG-Fe(II) oxygenase family protein [Paraglaciecola hydrolytica]|uniref:2-oxoglutarate-dependent ethylene/succinate-forming enzyme n=1 Tax=Paraglaciecola hydrolytica TaxID=1799789 RepID=A0A136A2S1_9ALTE|nr:2OG-Fe(II) oxygenase family protein [Paraglaciecola hydrolytica]KXI29497.1 2OG-Fe(II) oxygenase [Paraglaciecola hydrolytica]
MELVAIDYKAPNADKLFVESLHKTGFGVLKNHPIEQNVVQAIYKNWQKFFNSEEKTQFAYDKATHDGFFSTQVSETAKGNKKKDIKEYFHYYPWGRCPSELKQQAVDYYQAANELASELLSWVEKYSPPEVSALYSQSLSSMVINSEQTLLRILHYPPITGSEEPDAIRAAAHEDINLLTILPAANEPGLQVKGTGDEWIEVPCDFGNLIVNIGDMLQEASGGYFPSTTHRVINPKGSDQSKPRISLPLFLHPNPQVVLSPRHTAKSYLQERLRELGVA